MARTLSSSTIGAELYSDTDLIYDGYTIPNNTNNTSDAFLFGNTLHGLELVGKADTDITVADTKNFKFEVLTSDTETGSFASVDTVYDLTSSGGDTITAGTELFRYVANSDQKTWYQVKVTSTETGESGTFTVYIASVRKN